MSNKNDDVFQMAVGKGTLEATWEAHSSWHGQMSTGWTKGKLKETNSISVSGKRVHGLCFRRAQERSGRTSGGSSSLGWEWGCREKRIRAVGIGEPGCGRANTRQEQLNGGKVSVTWGFRGIPVHYRRDISVVCGPGGSGSSHGMNQEAKLWQEPEVDMTFQVPPQEIYFSQADPAS